MGFDQFGNYDPVIRSLVLRTDGSRGWAAGDVFGEVRVGAGNRVQLFSYFSSTVTPVLANVYATLKIDWTPGAKYKAKGVETNLLSGVEREYEQKFYDPDDTANFNPALWFSPTTKEVVLDPDPPPVDGDQFETMTELKYDYLQYSVKRGSLDPDTVHPTGRPITDLIAPMDWMRITVIDLSGVLAIPVGIGSDWRIYALIGANAQ